MAGQRDYYADLGMPRDADVEAIKKQYRKLALKYHPDRNNGNEQEAIAKFQVIQEAHEVLSDPAAKAKYDASLGRNRYPGASGVKGNPWANVGQQFPTPPRRTTASKNATSGAQRWQSRFSSGVPPTAKQTFGSEPDAKKNAAKAFENMRKNTRGEARPSQPPPPPPRQPPRTESARQRQEASFGSRKTGYYPRSTMTGDEPPFTSSNYTSSERRDVPPPPPQRPGPNPMPDPLSQFRDNGTSSDPNQSPDDKQRSSSVPRPPTKDEPDANIRVPTDTYPDSQSAVEDTGAYTNHSFKSRADARFNASSTKPSTENPAKDQPSNNADGPTMYESPQRHNLHKQSIFASYEPGFVKPAISWTFPATGLDSSGTACQNRSPSGNKCGSITLASFERQQTILLNKLICNKEGSTGTEKLENAPLTDTYKIATKRVHLADHSQPLSFSFPVDDDTFSEAPKSPMGHNFAKSSFDDINTSFVKDDSNANAYQFNAGRGEGDANVGTRASLHSRRTRRSPTKRPRTRNGDGASAASNASQTESGFNPEGWSDKFNAQTFVPQPQAGPSASPTRATRTNSRKTRTKPTAGTAAVVEESSSEEELEEAYEWRGRNAQTQGKASANDSPLAMDIDSPMSSSSGTSTAQTARNIPVEPSRPEWRAGKVDGGVAQDEKPQRPAKIPLDANAAGSEDSEEFRATFTDLKNVAPFSQKQEGLESFSGMKDNLPFESKASDVPPVQAPDTTPLEFPNAPLAPRLPPTVAIDGMKPNTASWVKYVDDFESYLRQWDSFDGLVVDHFASRKLLVENARASRGYGFLAARGDADLQEYYGWIQQDNDVRRRWMDACEEHEKRMREFMAFRGKMKDSRA